MKRLLTPIITLVLAAAIGWGMADHTAISEPVTPSQPLTVVLGMNHQAPVLKHVEPLSELLRRKAYRFARHVQFGQTFGYIDAPRLGLHHWTIREGTAHRLLDLGPGHYQGTTVPGARGTVAIAGHDVTPVGPLPYGPFHWLNRMRPGDKVTITMPYGKFIYTFHRHTIINPDSGAIDTYRPNIGDRLVLSMCWPRYTADKRYVVILWLQQEKV